jgi:hypothetical protein
MLDVLEDRLHRSSPSHDSPRQQHSSSIFNKADRLYTADEYVVPLSGNQGPISHGLSAAERREDQTAIATVENVRVQTKVLSALALEMDKAVTDKKKKKELAVMVADTLQLWEAMASAAFASRKKLELGSETVRKMEKTETVGFVAEEEKERVEKINKENEELAKLKQRNFFNGGEDQLQLPPATTERFQRKEIGQAQLQRQTASALQHLLPQWIQ